MSAKRPTIDQIGSELVDTSRKQDQISLPLSTRLFPYIYVASRRMSLRVMSSWLKDTHGVNISAGQISRALRQPELHLERLAEFIAPVASYVATAYGHQPLDLLYGEVIKNGPSQLHVLATHDHKNPESEADIPRWDELQYLASLWEPIPHESQLLLEPYLREIFYDEEPSPDEIE